MPISLSQRPQERLSFTPFQQVLLAILAGGLLSIGFLAHDLFYVTWIAFIPFLLAIRQSSLLASYFLGLVTGLTTFLTGTYWIAHFIMQSKGYSAVGSVLMASFYWLYCAHLFAFIAVLFTGLARRTKLHEFLLFPLIVITMTSGFPMLFALRLGESQVNFTLALQAVEFTGVHGLDGIIALVNIMLFRVIYFLVNRKYSNTPISVWPWTVAVALIGSWFLYGAIVSPMWDEKIKRWDTLRVGLVQPNESPSLATDILYSGYSRAYPPEMEMSERLVAASAEIIVWPEAQYKAYFDQKSTKEAYQRQVKALDVSLIFQDMQGIRNPINNKLTHRYNSAVMLDGNGKQSAQYSKIKRIPFGEYVPLVSDIPAFKNWAESYLGEFLNEVSKGDTYTIFEHEKVNIVPLICYETTFPEFVGEAVNYNSNTSNSKKGSLLVALSNNGWFGSTHQPYQHVVASVLRSVENRIPLVHVVNNGPSIVVVPSGKIIFESDLERAGGYIVDVPYANSTQESFYSRYPNLLTYSAYILLLGIILISIASVSLFKKTRR